MFPYHSNLMLWADTLGSSGIFDCWEDLAVATAVLEAELGSGYC